MASLSFDNSKGAVPIAIVKGGDYDKEVLYLHEKSSTDAKPSRKPKNEINALKYSKDLKSFGLTPTQRTKTINKLQEAMAKGIPSNMLLENENIKNLYSKIQLDDEKDTSITLPSDSSFQLIPSTDPEKRQIYYIAGASGSGKSYVARGLAEYYKKLYPNREIYLISKLNEDSTLDNMKIGKPKRINVQSLVDDYPPIEDFKDCMIIFDDYDTFEGKTGKIVQQLIDDLAIQGRHTNTTMLCLTHYITNYKKTRLMLNEATHFVVYPQATSFSALKYLLSTHIGLDKEEIHKMKKMGRWVCVSKNYPQFMISEHTAKILHCD
jgi:hypothetical protein